MQKEIDSRLEKQLKKLLKMTKAKRNNQIVKKMVENTQANLEEIMPRLEELRRKIKTVKGSITYSQSGNYVKLRQASQVNAKEALVFYQLVRTWQEDTKIELYYYPLMNSFYVK